MSVTLSLFAGAGAQFLDNNGNVLSGGLIYTYNAGTTTPLATYTSNLGTVAHPNPIVLDSAGRIQGGELWLTTGFGYKFVTKDSNNVLIGTYDNVPSSAQPPIVNDASSIAYEQGNSTTAGAFIIGQTYLITFIGTTNFQLIGASANQIGVHFIATGVGSGNGTAEYSRTVQSKLRETVSVKDFGAVGNNVADDTVAIQAALDSLTAGGQLYFPPGTYLVSGGGLLLQPKSNTTMVGVSGATTLKISSAPSTVSIFGTLNAVSNLIFDGLIFDGNSSVVLGFDTFGLQFPDVGDITVKNCTFKNFVRDGMLLGLTTKVDHLTVDTCNFSNIGFNGVRAYNARMQYINNSRFFDFITSSLDFNPILVENSETTTIVTNNYFSNDSANWLSGNSTLSLMSDRSYAAGNTIIGGGMIVVHSGPYGRTGIKSYRIIGNSIQNTVSPGIIVNTDVNTDIIVSNNYIQNPFSSGIYIVSVNAPPYTANTPVIVSNNIIQDISNDTYISTFQPACIKVGQTSNVIVTGNQCITPRWAGIAILSGANNCTVQGNTIIGQRGQAPTDFLTNVGGGIVVSTSGISFNDDIFNITINGNFIYDFLTTVSPPSNNFRAGGIVAYSDGGKILEYITITNNVVRNGNGIAIQTYFLKNSTVDGNTIWNSNGDIVDTSSTTLLLNAVIGQYTAAPTTGTWKRGTILYNSTPASAGYVGWACTAAGTPGTWKTFGLIS